MNVIRFTSNPQLFIHECAVIKLSKWWEESEWQAPYWRLYYCCSEGIKLVLENEELPLISGNIYLIPPNTSFSGKVDKVVKKLYIHFHLEGAFNPIVDHVLKFKADNIMKSIINDICHDLSEDTDHTISVSLMTQQLIMAALKLIPEECFKNLLLDPRIMEVNHFVAVNLNRKIMNSELSKIAMMETTAFIRLFNKITGLSPQEYVVEKRIEKACLLLHFSNLSIDEIAQETGFCDRYHFSKVFKKIRYITPVKFRHSHLHSTEKIGWNNYSVH